MKLILYALYVLISILALCGECTADNMTVFTLYYAFWITNAFISARLVNKLIKQQQYDKLQDE